MDSIVQREGNSTMATGQPAEARMCWENLLFEEVLARWANGNELISNSDDERFIPAIKTPITSFPRELTYSEAGGELITGFRVKSSASQLGDTTRAV